LVDARSLLRELKNLADARGSIRGMDPARIEDEQYHFIGKDILYSTLFGPRCCSFPAIGRRRTCSRRLSHRRRREDVKSRGTFITAKSVMIRVSTRWLRYYYAAKLNHTMETST